MKPPEPHVTPSADDYEKLFWLVSGGRGTPASEYARARSTLFSLRARRHRVHTVKSADEP